MLLAPEVQGKDPERFVAIVSDVRMPGATGLVVLEGVQLFDELPPMILITAFGDKETHAEAHRLGAAATLDKPFAASELLAKVREVAPPGPARPR
jgi:DNA-binding NtrC family response regulator